MAGADGQPPSQVLPGGADQQGIGGSSGEWDVDLDFLDVFDDLALLAAEDVVVSASRRLQRIEESPSAITVITREQIRASGYDNLLDLMRLVPAADVYRLTQGQGAVGLRSRSSWAGDRLLVLVDGRDVALHLFSLPLWLTMPFDLDSIERIEIIRGPGSTLYGANASQGVVNIITRSPGSEPFAFGFNVGTSGLSNVVADVRAHGRIAEFGYFASAGWEQRAPYDWPDRVSYESWRGRLALDWARDDLSARIEAGVVQGDGHMVSFAGDGPMSVLWPYVLGRLSLGRTSILTVLDWNDSRIDPDLRLVHPDDPEGPPLATGPGLHFPTRSAEITAHHSFDLFRGNSLMVGGSARAIHHMEGSLVRCPEVPVSEFDPAECLPIDLWETRLGLFLQDEWYLRDSLLLNLGGRLDFNSLTRQPGFSPRAALVYGPRPGRALRISYGRAYRKPTFTETDLGILPVIHEETPADLGRRLQYVFSRMGNRELNNEYFEALELGGRMRLLDERLVVSVESYLGRISDTIYAYTRSFDLVPGFGGVAAIPDEAEITFENSPQDWIAVGGEVQVTGRPLPWLELTGSYALDRIYLSTTDDGSSEWLRPEEQEPEHRFIASARIMLGQLTCGVDGFLFSRYMTNLNDPVSALNPIGQAEVGGTLLLNAHVSYRLTTRGMGSWELGVAALNALDSNYQEVAGHEVDGLPRGGGETIGRRGRIFLRGSF